MRIKDFFSTHPVFRYDEIKKSMRDETNANDQSLRQALSYYHKQGKLVNIRRLLYAVKSDMNYADAIDPYLVAGKATNDAVLAYHTALEYHNLAYTTFEELYYLSASAGRSFSFQDRRYCSVSYPKSLMEQKKDSYGIDVVQRQGVSLRVTGLERTIVDILDRPDLAGGWEEISRSLEHIVQLNMRTLVTYTLLLNKASIAAKVGFFLEHLPEHLSIEKKYINQLLKHIPQKPYYMDNTQKGAGKGSYVEKWHLIVPDYLLEQQWEEPHADDI